MHKLARNLLFSLVGLLGLSSVAFAQESQDDSNSEGETPSFDVFSSSSDRENAGNSEGIIVVTSSSQDSANDSAGPDSGSDSAPQTVADLDAAPVNDASADTAPATVADMAPANDASADTAPATVADMAPANDASADAAPATVADMAPANDASADTAPATVADMAPANDASADAAPATVADMAPANNASAPVAPTQTAAVTEQAQLPEEPTLMTEALLDKQLREVSTSVDTLKEDTFTTKSRLLLLREEVLQRSVGGARLQLKHKFDMGGQYELVQVVYAVDQEPVFSKQDPSGKLNQMDDEIIYDKMIAPGPHQLSVLYVYKGRPWGVFRYMKGYTFRVESGYDFNVEEGKAAELIVTAAEDGNFFTSYEKRPGVKYDYQQYELTPQTAQIAETASTKAESSQE